MKYSNEEIFNFAAKTILRIFGHVDKKAVTKDAKLKYDLGFDDYDKQAIISQFEAEFGGFIPYTKSFKNAITLGEFCDILCKDMNNQKANEENIKLLQNNKNSLFYRLKSIFTRQN